MFSRRFVIQKSSHERNAFTNRLMFWPAAQFLDQSMEIFERDVLALLQEGTSQTGPSHVEQYFLKSMEDARRGLEDADFEPSIF